MEIGERLARLETWQEDMDHLLKGNGQPGLLKQVSDYFAVQADKEKREKDSQFRTTVMISVLVIVAPILWEAAKHAIGLHW